MIIPPRFEKTKYDDVPKEIKDVVESLNMVRRGLYIHGDVGTGKTHIVYAVARYVEETMGKKVRVYTSPDLFAKMRDSLDGEYKGFIRDLLEYRGLLIIDDIGAEKPTDWVMEQLYRIINMRYNEILPTIFTSNYSLKDLSEKIDGRIPSRIVEMCEIVELTGKDKRLTKK
jgi:DNA replication protein DnaC